MSIFALDNKLIFPPVHLSEPDGLLAIGGDLSPERLLLAYKNGIFPWYEGEYILWWSPDPRCVLFPDELKVSHSMKQLLKREAFTFTINQAFSEVIRTCKEINRKSQASTWITDDVEKAYMNMHALGYAHSAEVWLDGQLAGGLYGLRMGKVFFGESMFSHTSNASKYAFISYVQLLQAQGIELVDCQVHTTHLESMGARMLPRKEFLQLLHRLL
ncbi:MAG: leucyl/phenylalanyl-tRNA--protein transferase [Chitinophagaceae bacterium]